jgi:S-DNA-T family DNA segregation ATPase FtsK/SpoIIIE
MSREASREVLAFLILGLAAFFLVALFSQDDTLDYLDGAGTARNACGPAGAFVSHHLVVWLGKLGAYGLSLAGAAIGLGIFFRRRMAQGAWKALGVLIAVLVLASFEVAVDSGLGRKDTLPGGFVGQYFYLALFSHLSIFGTYLLLLVAAVVAFVISTDTVFYPALASTQRAVLDASRWKERVLFVRARLPLSPAAKLLRAVTAPLRFVSRLRERREASEPAAEDAPATARARPIESGAAAEPRGMPSTHAPTAEEAAASSAPAPLLASPPAAPGSTGFAIKIHAAEPVTAPTPKPTRPRRKEDYRLPPLDLLKPSPLDVNPIDRTLIEQTAAKIESTLQTFKVEARVVEVQRGPTITQFEVSLAAGIKVNTVLNLSDDLAMALKAPSIRIVAPIPGKSTVGIEVPNRNRSTVGLRELIDATRSRNEDFKLPLALGRDTAGAPVVGELGEMPHLLIAGSTGSGKSVCINSVIVNILMTRTPDEVKLILVDPKMVELAQFENIPHLLSPVVTDMKKAPAVLNWLVDKMEERYEALALAGVRHISSFNALGPQKLRERLEGKLDEESIAEFPHHMPNVIVIIDELADLMMQASKEVEASITRLSQKSRAVGIHVILATQRPSVDVITGLIKANMPSRISFRVASKVDSRTILDRNGAEKLLGKGDMLYLPPGTSDLVRVQGTFISDREIRDVVEFVTAQAEPQFNSELTRFGVEGAADGSDEDDLFDEAVRIVLGSGRGSVTLLQRQLQIGYTRASRLMEMMHERGMVGPFKGSKAREVYYTLEEYEKSRSRQKAEEHEET